MSGDKGQIFTLDVLAAILGITILIGVTVQYQSMIQRRSTTENTEMKMLASDAAQLLVKQRAIKQNSANTINPDTEQNITSTLDELTGEKYEYEVQGAFSINTGDCSDGEQVVNSRRLVNDEGNPQHLTVVICHG